MEEEMRKTLRIFHVMLEDKKGTFAGVLYCHKKRKLTRLEEFDTRKTCPGCACTFPLMRTEIFYVSSLTHLARVIAKMYDMDGLPVPERFIMGYITSHLKTPDKDMAA
ncbi:MAG: hypothetical protein HGB08_01785 [Candidatus Moranbacteria bacterium]|nr:hypothetical protein [Candidatus Moranbacteria bacterium]